MTPAGPERNNHIAELRGDDVNICLTAIECSNCTFETVHNCEPFRIMGKKYKPYSSEITAAMELLPDLINNGCYLTIQQSMDYKPDKARVTIVRYTQMIYQVEGNEIDQLIADAISGAWEKWMEETHG